MCVNNPPTLSIQLFSQMFRAPRGSWLSLGITHFHFRPEKNLACQKLVCFFPTVLVCLIKDITLCPQILFYVLRALHPTAASTTIAKLGQLCFLYHNRELRHTRLLGSWFFWSSLEENSWPNAQSASPLSPFLSLGKVTHFCGHAASLSQGSCPQLGLRCLFVFSYLALHTCKAGGLLLVPWFAGTLLLLDKNHQVTPCILLCNSKHLHISQTRVMQGLPVGVLPFQNHFPWFHQAEDSGGDLWWGGRAGGHCG